MSKMPSNNEIVSIDGLSFKFICNIIPRHDVHGNPIEFSPAAKFINERSIQLHSYGSGPFCWFQIPKNLHQLSGVYIIKIDDSIRYVGICEDLGKRFNHGYGNISPRNCYKGGQSTNCRVNSCILKEYKLGYTISLYFYETKELHLTEKNLIDLLKPVWNLKLGTMPQINHVKNEHNIATFKSKSMSKYKPITSYFERSTNQSESLSYVKIEEILGFRLPESAYTYRPWWANGGHIQANSWMIAGWKVDKVELGKSVVFKKISNINPTNQIDRKPDKSENVNIAYSYTSDIAKKIKELHQLMLEDVISKEEFNSKKSELLSRI
jgi:hypothetical protein